MKLQHIFFLLFLYHSNIYAQQEHVVIKNTGNIGIHTSTGDSILGKIFIFSYSVTNHCIDYENNQIKVILGIGDGKKQDYLDDKLIAVGVNYKDEKIAWSKDFYESKNDIILINNKLVEYTKNSTILYNSKNEKVWEVKNKIFFLDSKKNIAVGYKSGNRVDIIQAFNMQDGSLLWERKLHGERIINNIYYINDTVFFLKSGGYHAVNIKHGKGWDCNGKTMIVVESDNSGLAFAVTAASGLVGFAVLYAIKSKKNKVPINSPYIANLESNILYDQNNYYYASQNKISNYSDLGKFKWENKLQEKNSSKSTLVVSDSVLCLLNYGYATNSNTFRQIGKPFLQCYNKHTGALLFDTMLEKDALLDYKQIDDTLFILSHNCIRKFCISKQQMLVEKKYTLMPKQQFENYNCCALYKKTNNIYEQINTNNTRNSYINTSAGVSVLDENLKIMQQLPTESVYKVLYTNEKYLYIGNGSEIVLLKNKKVLASIAYSGVLEIVGANIFFIKKNEIVHVDLEKIWNEKE